jgi:putative membrane protein
MLRLLVQGPGYDGGWGWGMHPMNWMWGAGGLVMLLSMFLFWGLVIAAIVLAIRWLSRQGAVGPAGRSDTALDILRQRYARGEIDRDEFTAKKRDLE